MVWRVTGAAWFLALPESSTSRIGGMLFGGGVGLLVQALRSSRTLRNAAALQSAYITETDERNVLIGLQSARLTFTIVTATLMLAAIAVAFIDMRMCEVLLAVTFFIMLVWVVTKAYYTRKMK